MKLSQAEVIQLMRRRAGFNQGDFGALAFDTSFESGRTKIKNIELGKQSPTEKDLINMARVLKTSVSNLKPETFPPTAPVPADGAVLVEARVLKRFPGLATYLDMLNKAARLGDEALMDYIAAKLASVFAGIAPPRAVGGR